MRCSSERGGKGKDTRNALASKAAAFNSGSTGSFFWPTGTLVSVCTAFLEVGFGGWKNPNPLSRTPLYFLSSSAHASKYLVLAQNCNQDISACDKESEHLAGILWNTFARLGRAGCSPFHCPVDCWQRHHCSSNISRYKSLLINF